MIIPWSEARNRVTKKYAGRPLVGLSSYGSGVHGLSIPRSPWNVLAVLDDIPDGEDPRHLESPEVHVFQINRHFLAKGLSAGIVSLIEALFFADGCWSRDLQPLADNRELFVNRKLVYFLTTAARMNAGMCIYEKYNPMAAFHALRDMHTLCHLLSGGTFPFFPDAADPGLRSFLVEVRRGVISRDISVMRLVELSSRLAELSSSSPGLPDASKSEDFLQDWMASPGIR